jgi:DNA-binding PadR family transcriptional regulator
MEVSVSPKGASGAKPLTSSFFYILLALADQERHGLGIAAEVARRTDDEVDLGPGTLYNAIKKMLDAGLIEDSTTPRDPAVDDPRRRYYGITRTGRRALEAEARRLARIVDAAREKNVLHDLRPV